MKPQTLPVLTIGLLLGVSSALGQSAKAPPAPTAASPAATNTTDYSKIFKSDKEKNSYAIGMSWGVGLKAKMKSQDANLDLDAFTRGFRDNLDDGKSLITETQEREILNGYANELRAKADIKHKEEGVKNKAAGEAFLAKNKAIPGVVTLPSGLQYKVLAEGKGATPKPEDEVTVHYRGSLVDGTEFDSSFKRNQPFTAKARGGIIKGWTEALLLMKPGSKWQLVIPPDLAYGERGAGQQIGPNATLIFEVELLSVKSASAAPAPQATAPSAPLTSDIIKVPSQDELNKGAKIETIKAEDIDKEKAKTNK